MKKTGRLGKMRVDPMTLEDRLAVISDRRREASELSARLEGIERRLEGLLLIAKAIDQLAARMTKLERQVQELHDQWGPK
jgi:hypothetical protein